MVRIGGEDAARAIVTAMRDYTEEVSEAIRQEVDDASKDIKGGIETRSPRRTGKYRKGWKITKRDTQGVTSRIVHHSVPGYRLVHLLEHGHAKQGGGRVRAIPHVKPAADPRIEQMVENIKRIIERGG
jgi:hypothetical protein